MSEKKPQERNKICEDLRWHSERYLKDCGLKNASPNRLLVTPAHTRADTTARSALPHEMDVVS